MSSESTADSKPPAAPSPAAPQAAAPSTSAAPKADAGRYERLLAEARRMHGVSLGRDAWRQLRRNWSAMASLYFLVVVATLAALAPVLPLQSPILQDLIRRKNLPPSLTPHLLLIKDAKAGEITATEALAASAGDADARDPIRTLWHNPGLVTRLMLRVRLAIFGDWCVPSICGTDDLGRDVLSRIFWGARVSLVVGVVATFVSLVIGVTYGAVSGYLGGWVDAVMMRVVDVLYSIPFIFVVIFVITILSDEKVKTRYLQPYGIDQIMIFYVVIGLIYWLTMARVVRGQVMSLKNEQFIEAARTMGAGAARIVFRHLIPNVLGVVIVYLTLTIPNVMLFEAFLSFLGLGVQRPDMSWGLLMNEGVKVITPIKVYWWLVVFPGLTLTTTLFALNFLGDGLRDALDPRMKNK